MKNSRLWFMAREMRRAYRRQALQRRTSSDLNKALEHDLFAQHLHFVFRHKKIDVIIDVGANNGQFCSWIRSVLGSKLPIHSFEPDPETFVELEARVAREAGIFTYQMGVGAEAATLSLNVMQTSTLNSFLSPIESDILTGNRVTNKVGVQIVTLEHMINTVSELTSAQNIFLKTDTQGYDIQVLSGIGSAMPKIKAILMEAPFSQIYENAPNLSECLDFVERLGFNFVSLPVTHISNGRALDGDLLFLSPD